ncbi:hypothetical protein FY034_08005 [Trichlorobacter lovleyi]|uniref:hypothetical protein n=1 Tax=Trichlorobacter lovleyi TaxID=313985 RepID=UPI00223F2F88|nr:hypothetical protein [Trichlorobacter lovleyi]QOX78877.1 hypothetical protein FY034_08005 [Trichlorobacter lovleyi]
MNKLTCLISLRRLAQTLITVLMLISPLSFSTDKVTNFTYECPVSTTCTIKSNRRITLQRQFTAALVSPAPAVTSSYAVTAPRTPAVDQHCFPSHGRAPPA